MSDETRGQRRSKNNTQETRSLGQVVETLSHWLPNRLTEDFGEDMIVQIEDDGEWTGVSFFLQTKSTTDLVGTKLARRPVYSYSLEVRDLLRWESTSPPVVVVVWDVEAKTGIWMDVPAAVQSLDAGNAKWRSQKSASVHFPDGNRLDLCAGQSKLRRRLADLAIPAIGKGKTLNIRPTFEFPKDEEGQALFEQLKTTIDEGGTVTIPGKYIKAFQMSPWWERLYGSADVTQVTIGPSSSDVSLGFDLVAVGPERAHTMQLTLPRIKGGIRQVTYSNNETNDPARVTLILPGSQSKTRDELQATMSLSFPARDAFLTASMASFLLAVHDAGGCRLRHRETGIDLGEVALDLLRQIPERDELLAWERLAQKLIFIEATTAKFGRFDLSGGVTDADLLAIQALYAMCREESWERTGSFRFTLEPGAKVPSNMEGEVSFTPEFFGTWRVLGVSIPLKEVQMTVRDSKKFLVAVANAVEKGESSVELEDIRIAYKLLSWGDKSSQDGSASASASS